MTPQIHSILERMKNTLIEIDLLECDRIEDEGIDKLYTEGHHHYKRLTKLQSKYVDLEFDLRMELQN